MRKLNSMMSQGSERLCWLARVNQLSPVFTFCCLAGIGGGNFAGLVGADLRILALDMVDTRKLFVGGRRFFWGGFC